ncbi:flagellar filament capping protein FliD [Aeromonas hydrophila]|uniref:flagellar filament capping protein FliD n=1 Tax=Aeromonas hydrophila TaxID=644 RepID=UPI001914F7CD|nr:flagellar filament capping protein FliD [Aeromonas hydrophila]MBQ4676365.1 flagellar filament capping protein FliD [Aeromonas hydrophila]MBW3812970.1 flagellar filament capping protein FliD [Aeromonas hydrophila]MCF7678203.1 flagellar filament capping protein FliD [Aeromonas hydrophila]MCF7691251.1 flagellar filament capping protein FliD [Aeromonas hydrophila]MCF7773981.1 flagellar filament capping protein FliD [Aeromonas hydrophila]
MAITSAGAGSGIDLESVISASVAAKKAQLQKPILTKQNSTQISISGIGQLKSSLTAFTDILDTLSKPGAFNKRAVTITQDKDNPVMKVESKSGGSNGQYNITVNKLATTSRFEGEFSSSTTSLVTQDGQLTFTAGDKVFKVDVKAGDTLQDIRKSINSNGDNFGLSANIVNTADGKAKFVVDSGISGDGKDLVITGDNSELNVFATGAVGTVMNQKQAASSAEIVVDGNTLKSDTNVFDDSIQDLKVTVLRVSDKESDGSLKSNKVAITTDKTAIQDMVKQFIDGYNALQDKMDALGKRNSIVGGVRQDDGGALAGDASTRTISNFMANTVTNKAGTSTTYSTIFEVGIKMDNKGKLSLDKTKFDEAVDKNFDQVVGLFGGEKGIAATLNTDLKEYSKSGGMLDQRTDVLNSDLRSLNQKQAVSNAQLVKYEASLRAQYGSLDALLVKMNHSAAALQSLQVNNQK